MLDRIERYFSWLSPRYSLSRHFYMKPSFMASTCSRSSLSINFSISYKAFLVTCRLLFSKMIVMIYWSPKWFYSSSSCLSDRIRSSFRKTSKLPRLILLKSYTLEKCFLKKFSVGLGSICSSSDKKHSNRLLGGFSTCKICSHSWST